MKLFKNFMLVLFLAITFVACKKDKDVVVPAFIPEGHWSGKLSEGTAAPTGFFAMQLKPGGQLDRFSSSGAVSATGSWQLTGDTFTANYIFEGGTQVSLTGTLDQAQKRIEGTWSNNGNETGRFYALQIE